MQLDARLAAIAALVPHGTTLADIGADHAYLAATLVLHGHAPRAVVGDLSAGACEAARRTVGAQRLTQQIDVRQGDGLSVPLPGEAESIVIAGMALIADILAGAQDILGDVGTLVLQPMNGAEKLRRWLYAHDWTIERETLAHAGGHLYEIIRAVHGHTEMPDEALLHIGPQLVQQRDPFLGEHIARKAARLARAAEGMEGSAEARRSVEYRETVSLLAALRTLQALVDADRRTP